METMVKRLSEHRFFHGFDTVFPAAFADCASAGIFEPDTVIYRENDPADNFMLIQHGKIAIEIFVPARGYLMIQTLGPGDVLGWSWLFPPYRRRFDARAVERTEAILLDGLKLRTIAERDHDFGYELMKRFSRIVLDRLQAVSIKLIDIYGHHR